VARTSLPMRLAICVIVGALLLATPLEVTFAAQIQTSSDYDPLGKGSVFLKTSGLAIIGPGGAPLLLRGANFRGYENPNPTSAASIHTENAYKMLKSWGFNVVRLPIAWGNVEHSMGAYNDAYLSNYVDRDIQWAKKYGIYVILDMHQWKWNSKWGGNGAPGWVVKQYPSTQEGYLMAVEGFWEDETAISSYIQMWKHVAARYSNETTIAGYDVFNEPWSMFDTAKHTPTQMWQIEKVFYEEVIDGIRSVDPNHMIFIDPEPASVSSLNPVVRSNIVWAPHYYAWVYDYWGRAYFHANATFLEWSLKQFYNVIVKLNQPLWIGEFGIEMRVNGSDTWIRDTTMLFEKYQLGWAWWVYWPSNEPDMSLLNGDGTPRTYFTQLLAASLP
jgi:endoglycosylceramidase